MIEKRKQLFQNLEQKILSLRNENNLWTGRLSSSALSTSLAVFALWKYDKQKYQQQITQGLNWLVANRNADGAWGDTIRSQSNLSTTLITWATFSIVEKDEKFLETIRDAEAWLKRRVGSLEPEKLSQAILDHYKSDQTFSVPILAMCAISGRLGENGWTLVPQLPYHLAIFPHRLFRWLRLSVVSYAIPALIAIGLVKSQHSKKNMFRRAVRAICRKRVLDVLKAKQPDNGGFLEATPLTAFVLMSMVHADYQDLDVSEKAAQFLSHSIREDGSWPIDTNLSTWVSSLSLNALSDASLSLIDSQSDMQANLLEQQYKKIHPFTRTKPGGWAWTNLQGGVPDTDDTSGALIALHRLSKDKGLVLEAARNGISWLISLQNKDGGFPTFCKGWGKLPFDCSCPDISAHAIKAFVIWRDEFDKKFQKKINRSLKKAVSYLKKTQLQDGSFQPLWFGNELGEHHQNPVYGTSIVLYGLAELQKSGYEGLNTMIEKAVRFLSMTQHHHGGWGGDKDLPPSIEETSLALRAMAACGKESLAHRAAECLMQIIPENLDEIKATPIGLYFASLWYYEDMYPLVFACSALKELD
ncbi:squalene--hopene cyclase [Ancylomarina salipaludis]|uniref:Squalene--hopene cyclase n=1 Tax=Ancylomarina salipaludis TaxID=2501299 RepID=A0A4Q1JK38_9BACT|nr:prenyltransferase/squalene oxidase repeat-containing protein [Ancylomarina salipaludis]RXQ89882.1 squalene--hopene cyclase [Ancylomarina salipaludis]